MKRWMKTSVRAGTIGAAVLALAAWAPAAGAVSPVVRISGSASLTKTAAGTVSPAVFDVDTRFSTDTPGARPFTIQKAVIYFPDHAGTNGPMLPTCSARHDRGHEGPVHGALTCGA